MKNATDINTLETIELFLRDPLSIVTMNNKQIKFLQKCVERSKKHRPLTEYNIFVKEQIEKLKQNESMPLPRDRIKYIADLWKQHPIYKKQNAIVEQTETDQK